MIEIGKTDPPPVQSFSSKLCTGKIRHRRYSPTRHDFEYSSFYLWLNLDEIPSLFERCSFWSLEKFNLVTFNRSDFLSEYQDRSLKQAVEAKIFDYTGQVFCGQVFMLANLRFWGRQFNPVVFYYCYAAGTLEYIVAEINNTPWDEKFTYVLPVIDAGKDKTSSAGRLLNFVFSKTFHVSPFMPMDLQYDWRFYQQPQRTGQQLQFPEYTKQIIHMNVRKGAQVVFDATLQLTAQPLSQRSMYAIPFRYGLVSVKTLGRIYYQALKLWLKKVPFHGHPKLPTEARK